MGQSANEEIRIGLSGYFAGQVEVGDRRYAVYSANETEERIKARILRQQAAARMVLEVLNNVAIEHEVSPKSVLDELSYLTQDNNKGE
jgi:hypothetical protein